MCLPGEGQEQEEAGLQPGRSWEFTQRWERQVARGVSTAALLLTGLGP